ncbi:MAG: hemolysin family protein [Melioribacteraceae bacterium]|nr:hemolysin family protein [Melioribacteraceae bacterium]
MIKITVYLLISLLSSYYFYIVESTAVRFNSHHFDETEENKNYFSFLSKFNKEVYAFSLLGMIVSILFSFAVIILFVINPLHIVISYILLAILFLFMIAVFNYGKKTSIDFDLSQYYLLVKPIKPIIILLVKVLGKFNAIQVPQSNLYFGTPINLNAEFHEIIQEMPGISELKEDESDVINKIIENKNQKVNEAMTARTQIVGVEITAEIEEALNLFIDSGYSKIPVYEDNLDNIKGIIFSKDMFQSPKDIASIIRKVVYVPETKKSSEMLNQFLKDNFSFAVVVDEFGGTSGIITVEDLIEEMFGEIGDEYDVEEKIIRKLNDTTYILSGKVEIDFINEYYDLELPYGEYETIAGLISSITGKIPQRGENIKVDKFTFHIIKSDETKIEMVRMTLASEE